MMEYDVFISYSRADSDIVNTFVQQLESAGYKVWIDKAGVYSGSQFKSMIVQAIEDSKVFLFFSSKDSNASPWTAKEIGIAVNRQKPIIPIRLDNTRYNRDVEFDLINLDFVDYNNKSSHEYECNKLMRSLENLLSDNQPDQQPEEEKKIQIKLGFLKINRGLFAVLSLILSIAVICVLWYFTASHHSEEPLQNAPTDSVDLLSSIDIDNVPDPTAPQLVDLGLPSGTLWMDRNLGASSPEEQGKYFSWGETKEKDEYSFDTYFSKEQLEGNNRQLKVVRDEISGTKYDAATALLGPDYRMPRKDEMEELIKFCKWEYKRFNGKFGYEITGSNGQSIFLPYCGYIDGVEIQSGGVYWTGTAYNDCGVWHLDFNKDYHELSQSSSYEYGQPIRPVSKKDIQQ